MISYIKGDATKPVGDGNKIIVHCCNDCGRWGKGFVLAISKKWPITKECYLRVEIQDHLRLGYVQFVHVEPTIYVANLIGQHGIRSVGDEPPIRYWAIREGLGRVREFAEKHQATIHMPRMGAGLAGGDWETISQLIERELDELSVTVYDLE